MAVTVSKDGLYFPSGTNNIKWSQLRDTFKRNAPSEPQENGSLGTIISGAISASDLLRETDRSNTNPYVPDCDQNSDVGSSIDWKVSQMRDTIKYYWITETGDYDNFDIDSPPDNTTDWNGNIDKTIVKRIYINGDLGTTSPSNAAARLSARSCNLTIDIKSGGEMHGAGGAGATGYSGPGDNGGHALQIDNLAHENVRVYVRSGAEVWGGGGGGGHGAAGGQGCSGTCWDYEYTTVGSGCGWCGDCGSGWEQYGGCNSGGGCNCAGWGWWYGCRSNNLSSAQCRRQIYTTIDGGAGGSGGNGGPGRGDDHSGSLNGVAGAQGAAWSGCGSYDGTGVTGCQGVTGDPGGAGGDWGSAGVNGSASNGGIAGRAVTGAGYSVVGTINGSTLKGLYNP